MKKKILIVNANYYKDISNGLLSNAIKSLPKIFLIKIINVPGVFEIPVTISKNLNKFDAFIALGCVIKGKTPHFDLITKSSFDAILKLSLLYNKPIGNGIITALNVRQAQERSGIIKSNKGNKGLEAAKAVLSILKNVPKKI